MTNIKLTCNAHVESGEMRLPTEDGKPSIYVMSGDWYQADGLDGDGNEYIVLWDILPDWDGSDEGDACNWDRPAHIVRIAPWADVTDSAVIFY